MVKAAVVFLLLLAGALCAAAFWALSPSNVSQPPLTPPEERLPQPPPEEEKKAAELEFAASAEEEKPPTEQTSTWSVEQPRVEALAPWMGGCRSGESDGIWKDTTLRISGERFATAAGGVAVRIGDSNATVLRVAADGRTVECTLPPDPALCALPVGTTTAVPLRVGNVDPALGVLWARARLSFTFFSSGVRLPTTQQAVSAKKASANWRKVAITFAADVSDKFLYVLKTMMNALSEEWRFQLFLTPSAVEQLRKTDFVWSGVEAGRINVSMLKEGFTKRDYMESQLSVEFWERVDGDRVLLFHADSIVCSESPHKIEDYDAFDYLGAPWPSEPVGGNSGFSLRNKAPMLQLLNKRKAEAKKWIADHKGAQHINEDLFIGRNGPGTGMKIAPKSVERTFSVEQLFYPRPFATHKPWGNIGIGALAELLKNCKNLYPIIPDSYKRALEKHKQHPNHITTFFGRL